MENETLVLLSPPPEERLLAWLTEIYGKPVEIAKRELLRHRDLSYVERLFLKDAIPETLIYKVVLPPWEIEQDLYERILIPSVSNSPRLYLTGYCQGMTAMFIEDFGTRSLLDHANVETAVQAGTELAKLHRSFTYRIQEIGESNVLRYLLPADYESLCVEMNRSLAAWELLSAEQEEDLLMLASAIGSAMNSEPISLVHGDLYAENILIGRDRLTIIDWSWFTVIGAPLTDLATLAMDHFKNGSLVAFRSELIDAYCLEYSRNQQEVLQRLPYAEAFSRVLFLQWLVERRSRGIMGTTVGPVDRLISTIVEELRSRLRQLRGS